MNQQLCCFLLLNVLDFTFSGHVTTTYIEHTNSMSILHQTIFVLFGDK